MYVACGWLMIDVVASVVCCLYFVVVVGCVMLIAYCLLLFVASVLFGGVC